MVILGEAEWVWTSDIGKDSKNNFPFEKEGTGQVSVKKLDFPWSLLMFPPPS